MQTTAHYALSKPDPTDTYNKATDNTNMDTIDGQMYANAQAAAAAQATANAAIPQTEAGAANGVPTLDATGNVPASQLGNVPLVNDATTTVAGVLEAAKTPAAGVPVASTILADVSNEQITVITAVDVISVAPQQAGNYEVKVYLRVTTAATNVTVTITYADGGGAQSFPMWNQSTPIGSHNIQPPFFFNAVTGTNIKVTVTAGTANQAYVSVVLEGK